MKKRHARQLSQNQPILHFDVILRHDWPIEQCLLHIMVFFGGKTKSPCFDLFIHWLTKEVTNTYRSHFSRLYKNRSTYLAKKVLFVNVLLSFAEQLFFLVSKVNKLVIFCFSLQIGSAKEPPPSPPCSPELEDVFNKGFKLEPKQRPTAKELLKHQVFVTGKLHVL